MKTINKSKLFKRAWFLVKTKGFNLSLALKIVWAEMKEYILEKAKEALYADFVPTKVESSMCAESMENWKNKYNTCE